MNFLITGIDGFVGSNLTHCLGKDHVLYGVDVQKHKRKNEKARYNWEDLSKSLPQIDCVIHLAGIAKDTNDSSALDEYLNVNVGLTKKIFNWFLASEAQTFIFFSSVKAAIPFLQEGCVEESIEPAPQGPYGVSKVTAEQFILSQSKEASSKNKRVYILRPAMIYGEGNNGNIKTLWKFVSKGLPWPFGAYANKRSFCSIENICYAVERLAMSDNVDSGIYHICDDDTISTNELIRLLSLSLGRSPHIWFLPRCLINTLARVGHVLHLPFNSKVLGKLTENYIVSNEKVKRALHIERFPVDIREGLRKTFESFSTK